MDKSLMQMLVDCENHLGWIPEGRDLFKARAIMHSIITRALERQGRSLDDFSLAISFCRRRKQPISSPLQLLLIIPEARAMAAPAETFDLLDMRRGTAIAWEHQRLDDDSTYWIGRLVNSLGAGLFDVLGEWQEAGRGR